MDVIIKYEGIRKTIGDYESFIFREISQNEKMIIINLSRTLIALKSKFNPIQIAAKVVEYYFKKLVPLECYKENKTYTEIKITTSWYPGFPNDPEISENFNEFKIEISKKKMGFNID